MTVDSKPKTLYNVQECWRGTLWATSDRFDCWLAAIVPATPLAVTAASQQRRVQGGYFKGDNTRTCSVSSEYA
ncbi:MAG: hypothetical protein ACPHF4_09405, partial [Rubripirellula sp.]